MFFNNSGSDMLVVAFPACAPNEVMVLFRFEFLGASQYFMGDYPGDPGHPSNLKYILGDDITEEKKPALNNIVRMRILTSDIEPKNVYIHFSNKGHTYKEHVKI